MKRYCLLLLLCETSLAAEHVIQVDITNVTPRRGEVNVAVHNTGDSYLSREAEPFQAQSVVAEEVNMTFIFTRVPSGRYAVTIYQDLNSNGDLDSNFIGLPKEPYGFSNNPRIVFGPPKFKKAAFDVKQDRNIEIRLR